MKKLESSNIEMGNKKVAKLLIKLKNAWNIDEIAKRGAYFINSPESLLDAKLTTLHKHE